jgi:hypothetical protein
MATAQDEFNALFNKSGYEIGRRHPEDAAAVSDVSHSPSPVQSFLNIDDDDDAEDLAVKAMRGTYYVPRTARQANTGPKGVIADAQAFEQAKRQAQGIAAVGRKGRTSFMNGHTAQGTYKTEDFEKSSDDDDEAFMESWRQRRLQELTHRAQMNVLGLSGRRAHGDLRRVDAEGFLNAVEGAPADIVVITLIYDHNVRSPYWKKKREKTFIEN